MKDKDKIWEVVVVGGGPAGMMAAGRASARGKEVLLLEKNSTLGKKLLITGGGRCNVTNNKPEARKLAENYKVNPKAREGASGYEGGAKFLLSAFTQFGVKAALDFFHDRGMSTHEENEGRIFPNSNTAQSVWNVLVDYLRESKVSVQSNSVVSDVFMDEPSGNFVIKIKNKDTVFAKSVILATGGLSRPETGSSGDGFLWLKKMGHSIKDNDFALVPIALKDAWAKKLGGVVLEDVKISIFQDGQKQSSRKGKILFTHFGISGPTILAMSREVGELLKYGGVEILVDMFPGLNEKEIKESLQEILISQSNKKIKNVLGGLLRPAMVSPILSLLNIDGETPCHSVKKDDRKKLALICKALPLHPSHLLGEDKAVISSGGVTLEEVDLKTFESRLVPGLYVVGDVLDIDRPTGGYSLQLCWTSGFVSGNSV